MLDTCLAAGAHSPQSFVFQDRAARRFPLHPQAPRSPRGSYRDSPQPFAHQDVARGSRRRRCPPGRWVRLRQQQQQQRRWEYEPSRVGASVSLTGDFSDSGKAVERGYQLWADTVNANGGILGRQVKLKIVDDASSPVQVVTNYQNLINKDHVDLTFGPFSTLLTIPASRVAERYNYAFLAPAGGGPDVFAQNLHNFFFVQPAPTTQSGRRLRQLHPVLPASNAPRPRRTPSSTTRSPHRSPRTFGPSSRLQGSIPSTSRSTPPRRRTCRR